MHPAAQALLGELEAESAATRRLLERVPADQLGWQPHEKSMTLGQLAGHVAAIPGRLCTMIVAADDFDAAKTNFIPPQPESAEAILASFDDSLATAREQLGSLDEARAAGSWRLHRDGREIFTQPRLGVLRLMAFNHLYHHRGQLTVYLRLLGVPVPATYGRSADEAPFDA
ncbi:MAG: DinB family protein [Thermoanaerobaculia bacterium]